VSTRAAILVPLDAPGYPEGRYRAASAAMGRYHHFDGYPTELGVSLIEAYTGVFGGQRVNDASYVRMVKTLIFDHPAGWSTINGADWSLDPGFEELLEGGEVTNRPHCYCHGDRSEGAQTIVCINEGHAFCTGDKCDPLFNEWAYRLKPEGLEVWEAVSVNASYRHQYRRTVSWIVPNPRQVMAQIEAIGEEEE